MHMKIDIYRNFGIIYLQFKITINYITSILFPFPLISEGVKFCGV